MKLTDHSETEFICAGGNYEKTGFPPYDDSHETEEADLEPLLESERIDVSILHP